MDACPMLSTLDNCFVLRHKPPVRVGNAEEFNGLCFKHDRYEFTPVRGRMGLEARPDQCFGDTA